MSQVESKCKICRRAGEKLFLKGERCFTPKCALVRKPYPPGSQKSRRRGKPIRRSEYGMQLREKQKVRFLYGIGERQFANYVAFSLKDSSHDVVTALIIALESRIDNVVFRLGFAVSRSIARHMVSHGHILVNGKTVTIPSYTVHVGDAISLHPKFAVSSAVKNLDIILKKYKSPPWLDLDKEKKIGKVASPPQVDELVTSYNFKSIIEFYSR